MCTKRDSNPNGTELTTKPDQHYCHNMIINILIIIIVIIIIIYSPNRTRCTLTMQMQYTTADLNANPTIQQFNYKILPIAMLKHTY